MQSRTQARKDAVDGRDKRRRQDALDLMQSFVELHGDAAFSVSQHSGRFHCELKFHGDPSDIVETMRLFVQLANRRGAG